MQAERSTSFASFDTHERSSKGINGALTPARQRRTSNQHQKNTNDIYPASYPSDQAPSRLRLRQERLVGGEGISLQETEARIDELERSEFDLKLKLFYQEEQLVSASSGDDLLHLHKEVIDAKLVRTWPITNRSYVCLHTTRKDLNIEVCRLPDNLQRVCCVCVFGKVETPSGKLPQE